MKTKKEMTHVGGKERKRVHASSWLQGPHVGHKRQENESSHESGTQDSNNDYRQVRLMLKLDSDREEEGSPSLYNEEIFDTSYKWKP